MSSHAPTLAFPPLPSHPRDVPPWRARGASLAIEPSLVAWFLRTVEPVLRRYFRAEVFGVEHLPSQQTLLVANHDGGMLPLDGIFIGAAWYRRFGVERPLGILVHDMVMRFAGWLNRVGAILADRPHTQAALDAGYSILVYPGGSRETFRTYWQRKTVTLGDRSGFVRHALRHHIPITPVVSVGLHETFFVLLRGGWLADRLGVTRHLRADVFPLVAGLPFGIWPGVMFPQLPLPAKVTVQILPPIDVVALAEERLGRPLQPLTTDGSADPAIEQRDLVQEIFILVRDRMQHALTDLYRQRRHPILG